MESFKYLDENEKQNEKIKDHIYKLFFVSLGSIGVGFFASLLPQLKKGIFLNQIFVSAVLVILSFQCLSFYNSVVVKIIDSHVGNKMSYVLVGFSIILNAAAMYNGGFIWLGIGFIFLSMKSCQLFLLCRSSEIGKFSKRFFLKITLIYVLASVITFLLVYGIEKDTLKIEGTILSSIKLIKDVKSEITLIENLHSDIDFSNINSCLDIISKQLSFVIDLSRIIALTIALLLVLGINKVFVGRKNILNKLFKELDDYYHQHPTSYNNPPSLNGGHTKTISVISGLILILRPFASSLAGFLGIAASLSANNNLEWTKLLFIFSTIFLTSAYGFSLNDYCDVEKDLLNHQDRVIPSGKLKKIHVLLYCLIIMAMSILISSMINTTCFIINLLALTILSVYSQINNINGFIANLLTALICSLVLLFGSASGKLNMLILASSITVFFFILGREILLDIRDISADKAINKSSIPIIYGENKSLLFIGLLFLTSTLIGIFTGIIFGNYKYIILATFIPHLIIWIFFKKYLENKTIKDLNQFILFSRIAFIPYILGMVIC